MAVWRKQYPGRWFLIWTQPRASLLNLAKSVGSLVPPFELINVSKSSKFPLPFPATSSSFLPIQIWLIYGLMWLFGVQVSGLSTLCPLMPHEFPEKCPGFSPLPGTGLQESSLSVHDVMGVMELDLRRPGRGTFWCRKFNGFAMLWISSG